MPSHETVERFVARVMTNEHDRAIAEFYTIDSTMRENQDEPRRGRDNNVAREHGILEKTNRVTSECIRPVFVNGDYVVIRWKFRLVWLDGTVTDMEEIAYQRWDGDLIAEEQFFYDPAQRTPRKIS